MNEFYVYLYLREDGTPYYVGKGKGDRAFSNRRRKTKCPTDKTKIIFHSENLTEEEAFTIEKELIAKYGRKDNGTGILRNLTDGGEGMSGFIFTDEMKAEKSKNMKEIMNRPEVKAKHSAILKKAYARPDLRAKMSAAMRKKMNTPEMKAKMNSPEVRAKMLAAFNTPEAVAKRLEALNKPEVRAKRRESLKKTYATSERRAEMSLISKETMNKPEVKAKHLAAIREYWRKKREAKQASANTLTKFFSE